MVEYTGHDIKGRNVIDTDGSSLGHVDDVVFDPRAWEVRGLLVDLEKDVAEDLNVKRGIFKGGGKLTISRNRIESIGDNVLLNVNRNDIASLLREDERLR